MHPKKGRSISVACQHYSRTFARGERLDVIVARAAGVVAVAQAMASARGATRTFATDAVNITRDPSPATQSQPSSPDAERINDLTHLGQLHSKGVLTDAEFAAEKARILGE